MPPLTLTDLGAETASPSVRSFIQVFLPLADPLNKALRQQVWPNPVTLILFRRWVQAYLAVSLKSKAAAIVHELAPVLVQAYGSQECSLKHFRLLCAHLCFYALAWDAFPSGGARTDLGLVISDSDPKLEWPAWCEHLRQAEIAADTQWGRLLQPTASVRSAAPLPRVATVAHSRPKAVKRTPKKPLAAV